MSTILTAFHTHFAQALGRVSAVFQTIPGIDTGHDGCEIVLVSKDQQWMMSAFPILDDGHAGEVKVGIAPKAGEGWGQWVQLTVKYDPQGQVVEARVV